MVQRRPPKGPAPKGKKIQWVARWRDETRAEQSETFTTEAAAKRYENKMKEQVSSGTYVDPKKQEVLVGTLAQEWVDMTTHAGTRDNRRHLLNNLGKLENMPSGAVRKSHVVAWVKTLQDGRPWYNGKPLADSTIRVRLGQLQTLLQIAVDDEILPKNHATAVKKSLPAKLRPVTERQVPSVDEINSLIDTARKGGRVAGTTDKMHYLPPSEWLAQCIIIASETGLRVGEIAGLNGSDLDIENGTLHVQRQCPNRVGEDGPLKTESSDRYVPVSPALMRDLKRWIRGDDDRIVAGATGRGVSSPMVSSAVAKVRKIAGVSEQISMHGMRHFYATSLLAAGESLQTVAALLGHDQLSTTDRIYNHFLPGHLTAAQRSVHALAGSLRDGRGELRSVS
ncbi:tyrosine-type recombinase/integrase [Corynebacterium sp. AOP40-9SA-29]|uniref:tyrosine-type recombinase/integrase n=1 Tax=Corynebacterium sp. AOP40-9SA-29 TaxID=3457677 RepID=UPI004034B8FD